MRRAALACAVLLPPAWARAQEPVGARAFCLPGGAGRCFAFAITDGAAGFDVWLRDLSSQEDDAANPFAIRQFGLRRVNASAAGSVRTDLSSGFSNAKVFATGAAIRGPSGLDENTGATDWPAARTFDYTASGSYGLLGCAWPPPANLAFWGYVGVTCAPRGVDGWLRITYGARVWTEPLNFESPLWRPATRADVAVQVAGCTTHLGAASGVVGVVPGSVACDSSPYGLSVVPEPGVAWLVGTGGAGLLAGARARRRVRPLPRRVTGP